MSATITVHEPDGEGRVFVDIVGTINDEDFKTFKEKTDQFYLTAFGHPKKQVIVTLISYGGRINAALQIGDRIRKTGMYTFVPGDRTCTSACALIWLAGVSRTVGDTPQIGFHAVYDPKTGRETGAGNAVVGAYLRDLGIGYKAIDFMTRKGPASVEWLTPELAKEFGVAWAMLQSSRAIPIPPQPNLQRRVQAPPQVIAAWSQSARSHADSKRKAAEAEQPRLKEEVQRQAKAAAEADTKLKAAEAEQKKAEQDQKANPAPADIKMLFEIRRNMEAGKFPYDNWSTVKSFDECEQKCTDLARCNTFAFEKRSRSCYLYSRAELVPNANFDSGVRQSAAPTAARPKITDRFESPGQQAPDEPPCKIWPREARPGKQNLARLTNCAPAAVLGVRVNTRTAFARRNARQQRECACRHSSVPGGMRRTLSPGRDSCTALYPITSSARRSWPHARRVSA